MLALRLCKSKMVQWDLGQIRAVFRMCFRVFYLTCPVHIVSEQLMQREVRPGLRATCHPMADCQFGYSSCLDPARVSGHLRCRCGATLVAAVGLSEATIQQLGGWWSSTWQYHIQVSDSVMARFPVQSMVMDLRDSGCASSVEWAMDYQCLPDYVFYQ